MTIVDKRQPKPRKPHPESATPQPYQVHRPAFTDGNAPAPAVVAVDAQPRAGEPRDIRRHVPGHVGSVGVRSPR